MGRFRLLSWKRKVRSSKTAAMAVALVRGRKERTLIIVVQADLTYCTRTVTLKFWSCTMTKTTKTFTEKKMLENLD